MSTAERSTDWTAWKGLRRGIQWSVVAAVLLAVPLGFLAAYLPLLVLNFWLRWSLAFLVGWILFAVVHRASGMAGAASTTIAVLAAAAVFLSQHFVFAACGVLLTNGKLVSGEIWLDPMMIASTNMSTAIGLLFATLLCRDGGGIWQSVAGIFGAHIR